MPDATDPATGAPTVAISDLIAQADAQLAIVTSSTDQLTSAQAALDAARTAVTTASTGRDTAIKSTQQIGQQVIDALELKYLLRQPTA